MKCTKANPCGSGESYTLVERVNKINFICDIKNRKLYAVSLNYI